jgi:hypothetical protein
MLGAFEGVLDHRTTFFPCLFYHRSKEKTMQFAIYSSNTKKTHYNETGNDSYMQ